MRTFLYILISIVYIQGFGQDIIPNVTQLPTSPTSDYALINDYQGIVFDKESQEFLLILSKIKLLVRLLD